MVQTLFPSTCKTYQPVAQYSVIRCREETSLLWYSHQKCLFPILFIRDIKQAQLNDTLWGVILLVALKPCFDLLCFGATPVALRLPPTPSGSCGSEDGSRMKADTRTLEVALHPIFLFWDHMQWCSGFTSSSAQGAVWDAGLNPGQDKSPTCCTTTPAPPPYLPFE